MNYNSQIHKQSVKKVERFFCLTSRTGFVGEVPYAIVKMDKGMNVEGVKAWL